MYRITIDVETDPRQWPDKQHLAEAYARLLCEKTLSGRATVVQAEVVRQDLTVVG